MVQPGTPGFTGLDRYLALLTASPDRVGICRDDPSLAQLITTVTAELAHGQPVLRCRVAGLLLEWVSQAVRLGLMETSRHDHGLTERQLRLEKACWFIDHNYHRPLLLKDIAAVISISPGHCEELFRRELRTAPMRHLLAVRLEKAKAFLPDPSLKIKDVARLVGFTDEHHFGRMFKQRISQTPLEFRRAALGK
jgi:transcriptional regulator GlxA family with amidase domain